MSMIKKISNPCCNTTKEPVAFRYTYEDQDRIAVRNNLNGVYYAVGFSSCYNREYLEVDLKGRPIYEGECIQIEF